jgi:hypothetical protein
MPTTMHATRLVRAPKAPGARREYLGSYEWTPRFARWISEACGPTDRAARPEVRLRPEDWWRHPYLVERLPAHFDPPVIEALIALKSAQAAFAAWEHTVWRGDEAAFDQEQMVHLDRTTAIAQAARAALDLPSTTHERALSWLVREGERVERFVWRTYYPTRRHQPR